MGQNVSCVKTNKKINQKYKEKGQKALIQAPNSVTSMSIKTINCSEETVASSTNIRSVYEFDSKIIGRGHYGVVRKAWKKNNSSRIFAVKTMSKTKLKSELYLLVRELDILKTLDHPNIIKLYEVYQDKKFFHLVMEYCAGGALFQRIMTKKRFNENEGAVLMKKICSAVNYLHENGIVHRDLKPENFIFVDDSVDAEVKLIDFGLSNHYFQSFTTLKSIVGTALYVAPEVWTGKYTNNCDMWSVGVIAHVLLSGNPPFIGNNQREVIQKAKNNKLKLNGPEWSQISKKAKNFISKLLVVDEKMRMNSSMAIEHPWIRKQMTWKKDNQSNLRIHSNIVNLLRNYNDKSKFKKEAMRVIAQLLKEEEQENLRSSFHLLDPNNTGLLTFKQVEQVLMQKGFKNVEEIIKNKLISSGISENQQISYSEFLAGSLDVTKIDTTILKEAFSYFDVDNTNFISQANLVEAMARTGRKFPENEINSMLQEVDLLKNNRITYEEFAEFIQPNSNQFENIASENNLEKKKISKDYNQELNENLSITFSKQLKQYSIPKVKFLDQYSTSL